MQKFNFSGICLIELLTDIELNNDVNVVVILQERTDKCHLHPKSNLFQNWTTPRKRIRRASPATNPGPSRTMIGAPALFQSQLSKTMREFHKRKPSMAMASRMASRMVTVKMVSIRAQCRRLNTTTPLPKSTSYLHPSNSSSPILRQSKRQTSPMTAKE